LAGRRYHQQQALLRRWDLKRINVPFDCLQRSLRHGRVRCGKSAEINKPLELSRGRPVPQRPPCSPVARLHRRGAKTSGSRRTIAPISQGKHCIKAEGPETSSNKLAPCFDYRSRTAGNRAAQPRQFCRDGIATSYRPAASPPRSSAVSTAGRLFRSVFHVILRVGVIRFPAPGPARQRVGERIEIEIDHGRGEQCQSLADE